MSPVFGRDTAGHDRARELAAIRVDEPLEAADDAWLAAHLLACGPCAAVAEAYDADRRLFGALLDAPPVPPRDLWARTAAAIDAEAGHRRGARFGRRILGFPSAVLAPVAGLAVVAVVVGSGLLSGSPVTLQPGGSGPPPTPIALAPGDFAVLTRSADGSYQVQRGTLDEVCPLSAETCSATPSFESTQLARIGSADSVGAIISPSKDHLVVVQRGATGADGVYVVPVRPGVGGAGTATATTRPSEAPATSPLTASATPASSAPATDEPLPTATASESPATSPSASAPVEPSGTPVEPSGTPVEPSGTPVESPSVEPPTAEPTGSPEPSPEPTPTVAVTPAPGGGDAIQIAKDVVVVGGVAAYNTDGSRFAFTARPANGSRGPDVYVWNTSEPLARAVTTDHRSIFAGWDGRELLVSRVVDGTPRTFAVNVRTGATDEHGEQAWLPTVAPDGEQAAWWDGSVDLADDDLTWVPDKGRLVLGDWPGAGGDMQVLAKGSVGAWEVRWDPAGTVIGVWTADSASAKGGRLSLYPVDPETGRARLGSPILDGVAAFAGFAIEDGRLIYPGPGSAGVARSLWVVAWKGDSVVGRVELGGEGGATVIR